MWAPGIPPGGYIAYDEVLIPTCGPEPPWKPRVHGCLGPSAAPPGPAVPLTVAAECYSTDPLESSSPAKRIHPRALDLLCAELMKILGDLGKCSSIFVNTKSCSC